MKWKRSKKIGVLLQMVMLTVTMQINVDAYADEPDDLYAKAAVLMDGESGRVLYGKEEHTVRPMASTTKIMTCILALEYLKDHPKGTIEVSKLAAAQPKVHLGMQEGECYYLKDLLYSLMLESHNDSAVAIAEGVAGSVEEFARDMNQKAEAIGCKDTHFVTPNGLDSEDENGIHATTARDLAWILRYCIMQSAEKKEFLEITQTRSYQFTDTKKTRNFVCQNHNALLNMMEGAISGKTGFTGNAGYCYVGAVKKDTRTFIVSLLACGWPGNREYKWKDTATLINYGTEHYYYQTIEPGKLPDLTIQKGLDEKLPYRTRIKLPVSTDKKEQQKILIRDGEQIEKETHIPKKKEAPVKKGQKVGEITYTLNGNTVCEYTIVAKKAVKRRSFLCIFGIVCKTACL